MMIDSRMALILMVEGFFVLKYQGLCSPEGQKKLESIYVPSLTRSFTFDET